MVIKKRPRAASVGKNSSKQGSSAIRQKKSSSDAKIDYDGPDSDDESAAGNGKDFFEGENDNSDNESEVSENETADEKRIRLAKKFLAGLGGTESGNLSLDEKKRLTAS